MAEKRFPRQNDRFVMNNCKIANELRKYRDLAGCLNQVSLSSERVRRPSDAADYAEYYISQGLSYLDMVVANAAYTLMSSAADSPFHAETVARLMAGDPDWRIGEKRRGELEARLQKLAGTQIYILADHDHQVEKDLYEGAFLPLAWEKEGSKLRFRFRPGEPMPLYQYAEHHRQLIEVPVSRLRDAPGEGQAKRSNTERVLLLRHYLIQELEVLLYPGNKVKEQQIRLLKRDREGHEMGLLWILGIIPEQDEDKDYGLLAQKVQKTLGQMLAGWQDSGVLQAARYQLLPAEEGYGVRLTVEGGQV